ncbi:MAG: hypothetical protein V3U76_10190 [Granulosicoccus sp.]
MIGCIRRISEWLTISAVLLLIACGSNSSTEVDASGQVPNPGSAPAAVDDVLPTLQLLEDAPQLLNPVPDVVHTEVLADSGLQVAYTSAEQRKLIDPLYISAQWQHMQSCVGVTAAAPLVIITIGPVTPFMSSDDLLHHIDGTLTASANVTGAAATLQVQAADFDGSLGEPGFNLRSIMGRHLWLGASLAERDYPYTCAREPANSAIRI